MSLVLNSRAQKLTYLEDKMISFCFAEPFINTVLSDAGSTNSTISVAYTVDDDNLFDKLVFQIENPKITIEKLKDDPNKDVTFTGLEAGTQYLVDVQTVSGEQTSDKQTGIFATCKIFFYLETR